MVFTLITLNDNVASKYDKQLNEDNQNILQQLTREKEHHYFW